jgi:hypothetical protein
LSCLDEESFGLEDQLWKAVIEGVGNYLIVWGLRLCNSVIVNRGATTPAGCEAVRSTYGFADVLSIEGMLDDLRGWQCESWITRVTEVGGWCAELTEFLGGETHKAP